MRFLVIISTLLLVPAYAVILEWCFEWELKPRIEHQCRTWLDEADLRGVTLSLNHFDASLSGVCNDPDGRDKAQKIIERVRGLRMNENDNKVEVPARITSRFEGQDLYLSGWVNSVQTRRDLLDVVKRFRPDLNPYAENIRVSPHVVMGAPVTVASGTISESISSFLETIRAPSSLSIVPEDGFLRMRGFLPSTDLRARVIAAVQAKPWNWPIEASKLHASDHVTPAPFTKGDALPTLLRSFYNTPSPGTFSIDLRTGPRIKAFATPEMVSQWLAMLMPVSGAVRVPLDQITYLPSVYHFPGYKPESTLASSITLEAVHAILGTQKIYFASGSSIIEPEEQVKLGPLVYAINSAGPNAKFIVAGYADIGGEQASYKGVIKGLRATAVKKHLLRLGVQNDVLEVQSFDATRPGEVITEDGRRESRRVELLLK